MNDRAAYQHSRVIGDGSHARVKGSSRSVIISSNAIPRYAEYAYYFCLYYSMFGVIIPIPMLGGGMLAVLAAFCIMRLRQLKTVVYTAIFFPVGCAFFYLIVQVAVHDVSLRMEYVRPFVTWIPMIIITQSLCLRPGFLKRFAL